MPITKFSQSWSGKIFPDFFGTVRLRNDDKYFDGDVHDILLDGVNMGTARIVGVRVFRLESVRDNFTFLDAGLPAGKFAGMMTNMYKNHVHGGVKPSTEFHHITFQWQHRNYPVHQEYIAKFMERKLRDYQDALHNP